jgi:hypothetical protein
MRIKKIVKIMFVSIGTVRIKIKPNEKAKQHKIGAN